MQSRTLQPLAKPGELAAPTARATFPDAARTPWRGMAWHGTDRPWRELLPSTAGTLGPGIYLADSQCSAAAYGPMVATCWVEIENPWHLALDHQDPLTQEFDIDHPALRAVSALPEGAALIETMRHHESSHFGRNLQAALMGLGHDGIVGRYPDGSMEIVAWRCEQVRVDSWTPSGNGSTQREVSDAENVLRHRVS